MNTGEKCRYSKLLKEYNDIVYKYDVLFKNKQSLRASLASKKTDLTKLKGRMGGLQLV